MHAATEALFNLALVCWVIATIHLILAVVHAAAASRHLESAARQSYFVELLTATRGAEARRLAGIEGEARHAKAVTSAVTALTFGLMFAAFQLGVLGLSWMLSPPAN